MIILPLTAVQDKIDASEHLTKGLELIRTLTSELVIPDFIVPVIAGGAVRDAVFKDDTPHDIDIFFCYDGSGGAITSSSLRTKAVDTYDNMKLWFEDNGIETRSLSRETVLEYVNGTGQHYLDIIEFTLDGIVYQMMFNRDPQGLGRTLDEFPSMCRFAIAPQGLFFTFVSMATTLSDLPVATSERDLHYVIKKYPGERFLPFEGTGDMTSIITQRYSAVNNIDMLDVTVPAVNSTRWSSYNRLLNSSANVLRRIIRSKFGLAANVDLTNISAGNLHSAYSRNRVRSST